MTIKQSAWTGMVPVDDTALYVTDTGGPGRPVVYLNGAYADQSHWRRVIADLGSDYRHITYDERARGKSKRSADYSFEACLRDVDAVLKARGVDRPLLVGWSLGGVLSWHWADRNPDRVLGVVCVDAFPVGVTGEAGRAAIRKMFRRWRLLLPIAAPLGLAARMPDQHADVNIEVNEIAAASVPVLDRLTCPVRFVLATGDSLGTKDGEMEQGRAVLDPILARNPNLKVSVKVASNHSKILRHDSPAVAQTVRELAATRGHAEIAIEQGETRYEGVTWTTRSQIAANQLIPLPEPARRGLINLADDLIATTNRAVAVAAQLHPSDVKGANRSGHQAHSGRSAETLQIARPHDPAPGGPQR